MSDLRPETRGLDSFGLRPERGRERESERPRGLGILLGSLPQPLCGCCCCGRCELPQPPHVPAPGGPVGQLPRAAAVSALACGNSSVMSAIILVPCVANFTPRDGTMVPCIVPVVAHCLVTGPGKQMRRLSLMALQMAAVLLSLPPSASTADRVATGHHCSLHPRRAVSASSALRAFFTSSNAKHSCSAFPVVLLVLQAAPFSALSGARSCSRFSTDSAATLPCS